MGRVDPDMVVTMDYKTDLGVTIVVFDSFSLSWHSEISRVSSLMLV